MNLACESAFESMQKWALAVVLSVAPQVLAAGEVDVSVTAADRAAATAATARFQHARPQTNALRAENSTTLRIGGTSRAGLNQGERHEHHARPRYPGDLSFNGGAVLPNTVQHGVFVNPTSACPAPGCWGDPLGFLTNLNASQFIHVTDQYVAAKGDRRYPVGNNFVLRAPSSTTPLTDDDMAAYAHAAARASGQSGYGHVFHLFLPPGQDVCFDSSFSACYSPDLPPSFAFCGYHSSADFADLGHVVYTVEPYQAVPGCAVKPGTANGTVADSTNNTLSHELIETITDPDGTAWFNTSNLANLFSEIGDECSFVDLNSSGFDSSDLRLNGKAYSIQPEYSNVGHQCAVGRPDSDDHD